MVLVIDAERVFQVDVGYPGVEIGVLRVSTAGLPNSGVEMMN